MYPAMFHHLPEHLASRYVILYACVTMALDSNGPIIQFHFTSLHFTSLYLALKFFSYNIKITKGKDTYTIQVHEPEVETDGLKIILVLAKCMFSVY